MMNEIYQFKIEDAERFAIERGIRYKKLSTELAFETCPYCGGVSKVDRKKFSINSRTGQFQCLRASCGAKGNMLTLARDFNFSLSRDADEFYGIGERRKYRHFKPRDPIPPTPFAIEYMKGRGISEETCTKYHITDAEDKNIVFPFYNERNEVEFIKYRNPDPKPGEAKEWSEKNCKPILFGMAQCNLENKTLIITEGQIDSLSVAEAGIENAVSVPTGANGFTWVPHCWIWLQNFNKIIIFGDHEKGHITLYDAMLERFKSKVWHVAEEDYKDCKDANDILRKYGKEQIQKCIDGAIQAPVLKVISLDQVEDINPYDLEKVPTGISEVDKILCGGLPFGQVVLVTGKAGDGKSTFASQILLSAIDSGYKCFAYSGELPNYLFKSWLDFQAAGPKNVFDEMNRWMEKRHRVKKTARDEITKWYKDKIWLYDNNLVAETEEEEESLSRIIELVINQYGVRVILIDNLMTGLDLEAGLSADKFEKQSEFIKKLTKIAMQYNVLIVLVAHKKKGTSEVNEAVSGTLDIVNLASIVMSYERPHKIEDMAEKDDRMLKITKNRLFGKIITDGIKLHFHIPTKRIYIEQTEMFRPYSWEQSFAIAEDDEDLPF